jgi:hypothetical protein
MFVQKVIASSATGHPLERVERSTERIEHTPDGRREVSGRARREGGGEVGREDEVVSGRNLAGEERGGRGPPAVPPVAEHLDGTAGCSAVPAGREGLDGANADGASPQRVRPNVGGPRGAVPDQIDGVAARAREAVPFGERVARGWSVECGARCGRRRVGREETVRPEHVRGGHAAAVGLEVEGVAVPAPGTA